MSFWRWLRNLDRIEALTEELSSAAIGLDRARQELERSRAELTASIDRERAGRIAAESIAESRRQHIEAIEAEVGFHRSEMTRIMSERLKSLDAVNLRLMEPRIEAPPPDMKGFTEHMATERAGIQAITRVRQIHRQMDGLILSHLHPNFQKPSGGVPMNAPLAETAENSTAESSD